MNFLKGKHNRLSILLSFIVHFIAFVFLCMSLSFSHKAMKLNQISKEKVVEAVAIDEVQIKKEILKIKRKEDDKRRAEFEKEKRLERLEKKARDREFIAKKNLEKIKLKQKQAEKKLAKTKKRQTMEQKRLAELKKKRQSQNNAKDITKKTVETQISKEQQRLNTIRKQQILNEVNKYKALILNVIGQYWIMPANVDEHLSTKLLIRLAPGGIVLKVTMLKSSGNATLDRSVVNALWKSSPLPVPKDSKLFERFRELHLTVRPEGLL